MSAEQNRPPRWRRRIPRILLGTVLLPLGLLALGNLALATPWGKSLLAAKIKARTGLDAVVGSASCSPWGGAFLGDLKLLQPRPLDASIPAPVLEVESIRISPRWAGLLKGKLQIAEIRIERPRGAVALEMLAQLVPRATGGAPRPLVTNDSAGPANEGKVADVPALSSKAATPPDTAAQAETARLPERDADHDTTWIEVSDGELDLFLSGLNVIKVSGFGGHIPAGGAAAESEWTVKSVNVLAHSIARDLSLPLQWKGPVLRLGPGTIPVAGIQLRVEAAIGRLPGIPFAADLLAADQPVDGSELFKTMQPVASGLAGRIQGKGYLRFPMSWDAQAIAGANKMELTLGGQRHEFDEARGTFTLQGGTLQCPDAHMTGDTLSLLGNGTVNAGGEGNVVLRAVVRPEVAETWKQKLAPTIIPVFSAMDTPERVFIDLRWVSQGGNQAIEFGNGGTIVPLGEAGRLLAASGAN